MHAHRGVEHRGQLDAPVAQTHFRCADQVHIVPRPAQLQRLIAVRAAEVPIAAVQGHGAGQTVTEFIAEFPHGLAGIRIACAVAQLGQRQELCPLAERIGQLLHLDRPLLHAAPHCRFLTVDDGGVGEHDADVVDVVVAIQVGDGPPRRTVRLQLPRPLVLVSERKAVQHNPIVRQGIARPAALFVRIDRLVVPRRIRVHHQPPDRHRLLALNLLHDQLGQVALHRPRRSRPEPGHHPVAEQKGEERQDQAQPGDGHHDVAVADPAGCARRHFVVRPHPEEYQRARKRRGERQRQRQHRRHHIADELQQHPRPEHPFAERLDRRPHAQHQHQRRRRHHQQLHQLLENVSVQQHRPPSSIIPPRHSSALCGKAEIRNPKPESMTKFE